MTSMNNSSARESVGAVLKRARAESSLSYGDLSKKTGIARGQLFKLEQDQVKKVNPAHLAILAEPLGVSLYQLYAAAGYATPSALSHLGPELEDRLRQLPPDALKRLDGYIERLADEYGSTLESGQRAQSNNT